MHRQSKLGSRIDCEYDRHFAKLIDCGPLRQIGFFGLADRFQRTIATRLCIDPRRQAGDKVEGLDDVRRAC